jgi:hypothetical protein
MVPRPTVVWLVSLVAAFVTEGLFVGPSKVTVPRQEISCHVDVEGLLDMSTDEVVVAVSASRTDFLRSLGGQLGKTLNSRDVVFLLLGTECRPLGCQLALDLDPNL